MMSPRYRDGSCLGLLRRKTCCHSKTNRGLQTRLTFSNIPITRLTFSNTPITQLQLECGTARLDCRLLSIHVGTTATGANTTQEVPLTSRDSATGSSLTLCGMLCVCSYRVLKLNVTTTVLFFVPRSRRKSSILSKMIR
jgi:hypothetical protein